jgi:hypothetical protein
VADDPIDRTGAGEQRTRPTGEGGFQRAAVGQGVKRLTTWSGNSQEDNQGAIESQGVLIGETADPAAHFRFWYGCNFVDHEATQGVQAIFVVGLDGKAEEGSIGGI